MSSTIDPPTRDRAAALDFQVEYYATRRPKRMLALDTPYVRRHWSELQTDARLEPGQSVCEWGAGLGRFTRLLLEQELDVTAIELSPEQTKETTSVLGDPARLSMLCGDIAEVLETLDSGASEFDAMVGFFILHHLPDLESYLNAAFCRLKPGGRLVFIEPNPFHPLYPVQITFTPGMRWRAERAIYDLTPKKIEAVVARTGFGKLEIRRYGALPRAPYNWLAKTRTERLPERLLPNAVKPFQSIVVTR